MNINSFKLWLADDKRKPLIMGILNVTPDSFSDDGLYNSVENAVLRAIEMESEGADIIDIGGESTRPGADSVEIKEELQRVLPVIKRVRQESDITISIDTYKSYVAESAILAGANIINDISGLRSDSNMINVANESKVPVIIMHMLGNPQNMQDNPVYSDIMEEIGNYFHERIDVLTSNEIEKHNILIDPGVGFGKTVKHNLAILRDLRRLKDLNQPILVGPSRKSFIGKILNLPEDDRIEGTAAAVTTAIMNGADIVRVHDVKEMARVVKLTEKICEIS